MTAVAELELTAEQQKISDAILEYVEQGAAHMTVGGYAGTGKTTLISKTIAKLREKKDPPRLAFCCFTGKAASVLRSKLEAARAIEEGEHCGTIHALIYRPVLRAQRIIGWRKADDVDADFIFCDEASMVNKTIHEDLLSFGIPVAYVGDHGQLPPIGDDFNLMEKPDHRLEKIHRQAEASPIIRLSVMAREKGHVPFGPYDEVVSKIQGRPVDVVAKIKEVRDVLFLCGYNATRNVVNAAVRTRLGFSGEPKVGERVICLRNNREMRIFNGTSGRLVKLSDANKHCFDATIAMDDGIEYSGPIAKAQFGSPTTLKELGGISPKAFRGIDLFDYGYCLTVHKAQGSEAENVVLFEERFSAMTDLDWRRWLYTGVTRAKSKLLLVGR